MSTDPDIGPLATTPAPEAPLEAAVVPAAAPVAPAERQPTLDALRGLALLGVIGVNLPLLVGPDDRVFSLPWSESGAPRALAALHLLLAGKAYALLAFLFGAGLALQARRLGPRAATVLPRRLGALAAIGAVHGLLIWYGDILSGYAMIGFIWFLAFSGRTATTRARWAAALYLVLPVLTCAAGGALLLLGAVQPDALAKLEARGLEEARAAAARAIAAYGGDDLGALLLFRAKAFLATFFSSFGYAPQFLALFLAAGWAVERGVLQRPEGHRPLLARVAAAGILLGGAGELAYGALVRDGLARMTALTFGHGIHAASAPALSLGLTAALLLLWSTGRARLLLAVAPLGRVSLSAYLLQSLVFTTVAYGYGWGRYGTIPPDASLALAATTWVVQALLAPLWLSRFERGPAEWLWRRITYGGR